MIESSSIAALAFTFASGSASAALLTRWLTSRAERTRQAELRRGRARLLNEDFLHFQSTLARTFYKDGPCWWEDGWLLPVATSDESRLDLFAGLDKPGYHAVASGLGWMTFLIEAKKQGLPAPSDDEVEDVNERIGAARLALSKLGDFEYQPHDPRRMKPSKGARTDRNLDPVSVETAQFRLGAATKGAEPAP